jgi:hypothetical protein
VGQERRAQELLEGVDDAVQELEDQEWFDLGRGRQEEEEVRMAETENERRWVGVGQVDEVRAGGGVVEVEGQQVACRERA